MARIRIDCTCSDCEPCAECRGVNADERACVESPTIADTKSKRKPNCSTLVGDEELERRMIQYFVDHGWETDDWKR